MFASLESDRRNIALLLNRTVRQTRLLTRRGTDPELTNMVEAWDEPSVHEMEFTHDLFGAITSTSDAAPLPKPIGLLSFSDNCCGSIFLDPDRWSLVRRKGGHLSGVSQPTLQSRAYDASSLILSDPLLQIKCSSQTVGNLVYKKGQASRRRPTRQLQTCYLFDRWCFPD
jgi:hypothetical protein